MDDEDMYRLIDSPQRTGIGVVCNDVDRECRMKMMYVDAEVPRRTITITSKFAMIRDSVEKRQSRHWNFHPTSQDSI
jgi:hypothetical protein